MLDLARPVGAVPPRPRRPRLRRFAPLLALLLVVQLGAACLPATPQEKDIWVKTLDARTTAGLPNGLLPHDDLTVRAQSWARTLAAGGQLAHSDLKTLSTRWTAVAENVGRGSSPAAVFDLLMASPSHRANIVDPRWTQMGVGVATGRDGTNYVVQVFQRW